MPSFESALSGLQANTVALSTIGNNLSNLNTIAYKKQDVEFADLFYQSIGNTGASAPLQIGAGTRVSSVSSDFSEGNRATTGIPTDMAIIGNGFFVVNHDGISSLTRSGNFQLTQSGALTTSDGDPVMGYPIVDGTANTNAPLQAMSVPISGAQAAHPTTEFSFNTVLDANASVGSSFTSSTAIYDSKGTTHNVDVTFTKAAANQWSYDVELPPGEASTATGQTGTLVFNPDGSLATTTGTVAGIQFHGLTDGASDLQLNWQLHDASGNSLVTQNGVASSTNASSQDGYGAGSYKSFAVDANGILTATYTGGGTQVLGQLAVATVASMQSLTREGGNLYGVNTASGPMTLGLAGTGSYGTIDGGTLEQSNVDISTEFADLIVAQRAFEANSKTVTAFDTITQDTINMIR